MSNFSECYQKLKELMPKSLFKVSKNSIIYSGESNYEPTQELEIACHNPIQPEDDEISI